MKYTLLFLSAILISACNQKESAIEYPEYHYNLLFGENEAGYAISKKNEDGSFYFEYEFNDRGRGPHLKETIKLDDNGLIQYLEIQGHNYLKDTVTEIFKIEDGMAQWFSPSEKGETKVSDAFYAGINTVGSTELMIQKMMSNESQAIDLYPSGTAKITSIDEHTFADTLQLKLVEIVGFSFDPFYTWIDEDNRFFASPSTWLTSIRKGYEPLTESLLDIQTRKQKDGYRKKAEEFNQKAAGKLIIKNTNVLDVKSGDMRENMNVVVIGSTIESISNEDIEASDDDIVIDGTGKTLMPGLFDMHGHLSRSDGLMNIAAGVTSVRDMANSFDLPEIGIDFNSNSVIGPRILVMSGFIDQAGPYAGPVGKIINTLEEGIEAINFYHERGYQQIKLYSSIDPSWVKPLAEHAHEKGLRLSGHIPSYMLAEDAVKDGYDEIQHINMIALNFLGDTIDTRTPKRFSMIGEYAYTIDLEGEKFKDLVKLLLEKDIVVDPTVSIFDGMLTSKAGEPDPSFDTILDRLPIQVKRNFYSGGLPKAGSEEYLKSYQKLLAMVKALHDAGVRLVAGTDSMVGFGLHEELENYVRAGITAIDVLQIATINSANVIGVDKLGQIKEGYIADMILVDGNPVENISDIRKVEYTIKDGSLYNCIDLYSSIGVKPYNN